jgi:hypothetical protein
MGKALTALSELESFFKKEGTGLNPELLTSNIVNVLTSAKPFVHKSAELRKVG